MAQPAPKVSIVGPSFDQVVVDTGDLEGVQKILDDLRIEHREFDRIKAFDLVLLGVAAQDDTQVEALEGGPDARHEIEEYNAANGITAEVTAFDVLTRLLRDRFQAANKRDLKIGKNRDVDQLEALPHWGGGEGLPTAATADQFSLHGARAGLDPVTEAGMTIGVIDSALYRSPGLEGRVQDADETTDRPPRRAWEGHAAFVVGRILLRAPSANVIVRSVLDKNGMAKAWDVAYQMAKLVELGATVLNMALASYPADGAEPFLIGRAVKRVNEKALVVAAAGNHGAGNAAAITEGRSGLAVQVLTTSRTASAYPAASPGVVAVGAASVESVDGEFTLTPADFTPRVDWVRVWAPGVDQVSTFLEGNVEAWTAAVDGADATITSENLGSFAGYARWSGTSPATGDVSGEIARLADSNDLEGAQTALAAILRRPAVGKPDDTDIRPHGPDDWPQVDGSLG